MGTCSIFYVQKSPHWMIKGKQERNCLKYVASISIVQDDLDKNKVNIIWNCTTMISIDLLIMLHALSAFRDKNYYVDVSSFFF